jgi:N-succinyldiaminopimelate aminotransferase
MSVSRLAGMAGIGVDRMGHLADASGDPEILRLENLDTDLRPPPGVVEATRQAAAEDAANSYLPFLGFNPLRRAAAALVSRTSGVEIDWNASTVITAGGLTGILNVLLATLEPGDEVVLPDPIYIGLINRVRLAGGVPVFLPCEIADGVWKLDRDQVARVVTAKTRVFLMMSPAMPSGAVFSRDDWRAVCEACREADAWMLYDSAMERILFDGTEHVHPASFPGMAERTITAGSVSKEYRMIGWRVGWIVAPPQVVDDVGLVNISNVVCNVGIAQAAATVALETPDADVAAAAARWQRRRDVVLEELAGLPVVKPQGGWSLLMDVAGLRLTGAQASARLLDEGKVAATPMTGWGTSRSDGFVRFVFSNEPVARLRGLRARVEAALG